MPASPGDPRLQRSFVPTRENAFVDDESISMLSGPGDITT